MPAYYPPDVLDEMYEDAIAARERMCVWMGTQTYNNMKHLGHDADLEKCIEAYRNDPGWLED